MAIPMPNQKELIQLYTNEQAFFYSVIAGIMVLAYDYLLTLDTEIKYIWKRRRTLPAIIFLVLRYLLIIEMFLCTSTVFFPGIYEILPCPTVLRITNIGNDIVVILTGATMALRLMALYNWNKSILPALSGLLVGEIIILFVFTGEIIFSSPMMKGGPCVVKGGIAFFSVVWLCPLTVDTVIFGLTNYRLYQLRKLDSQTSPLLKMLRRDGILYYGVICITYAANIINYYVNPNQSSNGAGAIISMTLPSAMICRLIINLQELPSSLTEEDGRNSSSGAFTTYISHLSPSMNNRSPFFEEQWGTLRWNHVDVDVGHS